MILTFEGDINMAKPSHKHCQFLVTKFCGNSKQVSWAKEIKIAQKLLKLYPDVDFWSKISPAEKINTLSWYLTGEGKEWLIKSDVLKDFKFTNRKEHSLSKEKLIDTEKVKPQKPKSIFDFLDYGKNKEN